MGDSDGLNFLENALIIYSFSPFFTRIGAILKLIQRS